MFEDIIWVVVTGSALWVYYDASKNKIADAGLWAVATLGFWIIGFPVYLFKHSKLIEKAKTYPKEPSKFRGIILAIFGLLFVFTIVNLIKNQESYSSSDSSSIIQQSSTQSTDKRQTYTESNLITPGIEEYNKGVDLQQTNRTELAEQQFKLAIRKNPELAEAYLNIGLIYMNRTWYDGAEQMTNKCISILDRTQKTIVEGNTLNQSLSAAYNNLGAIEFGRCLQAENKYNYALAKQHWKSGMDYFRYAIKLDPMNSQAQASIQNFQDAY